MKAIIYFFALVTILQTTACSDDSGDSDDEKVSEKDQTISQLTATTWVVENVEHTTDGDLTSQYEDFSIIFTKSNTGNFIGNYLVANGGYAFTDASGKWNISDDLHTILLDNDTELAFEFQGERMILDFTVSAPGGRTKGLSGHFTFTLIHTP